MSDAPGRSAKFERITVADVGASLNAAKPSTTLGEIMCARAVRKEAEPFTEEYAMRDERLAEIEDRRPSHRIRS